jgi:hypothetical protein
MMMGQGQQRGQPRMRAAQGRFIDSVGIGPLNINPRIGISEIEEGIGPDVEKKTGSSNIGADIMLDIGKGIYGKAEYDKGRASEDIYFEGEKVLEDVPYDHDIWKYGGGFEKDGTRAEVVYDPEAERWEFKLVKSFNQGGRIGFGLGGIDKGRRAFMKWLAGILGTGVAAGTGLLKLGKTAKVVPKVTETIARGADGIPVYITDLIQVVKAKGTKDIIEGFKRSDYSTVHSYKGVDVVEDGAGNIKIKSDRGGVTTDSTTGKMHEGIAEERHIQIDKGGYVKNKKGKMVKEGDEYIEGSVRPDRDGKMKDFEDGLDEAVHLEFKKIADEVDTLEIPGYDRFSKASGGLAYMLGE